MKKFVDLDVIVLDEENKSNLYSYTVGVGQLLKKWKGFKR